jgi:O-antigen/teichoic acid export membrane protein
MLDARRHMAGMTTSFLTEVRQLLHQPMVSGGGLIALARYVAAGVGFLTAVVAARMLGPTDYGVVGLVMAYPALLRSFVSAKAVAVTTRYIAMFRAAGRHEELKSICKLGYGLDCLMCIVAFILVSTTSWWVAQHLYHMSDTAWLMVVYAASFPFLSFIGTSGGILCSWQRFHCMAILQVIEPVLTFVLVVGCLRAGFGVPGMIIATTIGQATSGITMLLTATSVLHRAGVGWWWHAPIDHMTPLRKELTAFFGWNYLLTTVNGFVGQVPTILLGRLRGPEQAGFYSLAVSLLTVVSYVETAIEKVIYPTLAARWGAGERQSIRRSLQHWTWRGGLPLGALVLCTVPLLPLILPAVFGAAYRPMVLGTQVMLIGAAVSAVFFWLHATYYAAGAIRLWTQAYTLYTVFVVGLAWLCIQWWGFSGLAVLVTVGKTLFTIVMVIVCIKAWERSS